MPNDGSVRFAERNHWHVEVSSPAAREDWPVHVTMRHGTSEESIKLPVVWLHSDKTNKVVTVNRSVELCTEKSLHPHSTLVIELSTMSGQNVVINILSLIHI